MSWEQSLDRYLDPPEPNEFEDSLGNTLYADEPYCAINGMVLGEESLDDVSRYLEEQGETFTCAGCGMEYGDDYDSKYYEINGECFCQECVDSAMVGEW